MENIDQRIIDLKQEALRRIIGDFSEEFLEDLDKYIDLIKVIYDDEFRHSYSNITAMLIKLNKENPQALEFVSNNFSSLVDKFPKEENLDAYKSLNKLYDHIILEQIRLTEVYSDSKELADNVARIIAELGLKQRAVAEKAGFEAQAFSDMLNGRRLIKLCDVVLIAEALGVTPNDLYGIEEDKDAS